METCSRLYTGARSLKLVSTTDLLNSPSGLFSATDSILQNLLERLNLWKTHLPDELAFSGLDSNPAAGMWLSLQNKSRNLTIYRLVARVLYMRLHDLLACLYENQLCLSTSLTIQSQRFGLEHGSRKFPFSHRMVHQARHLLGFLVPHFLLTCKLCFMSSTFIVFFFVMYQPNFKYHTWVRRKDNDAAECLRHLRDSVKKWEATAPLEDHGGRARVRISCLSTLYIRTYRQ